MDPVAIINHNKNLFLPDDSNIESNGARINIVEGRIELRGDFPAGVTGITSAPVRLYPSKTYCLSYESGEEHDISIVLLPKGTVVNTVVLPCTFSCERRVDQVIVNLHNNAPKHIDDILKVQFELGTTRTDYVPPVSSNTTFPIADVSGNVYYGTSVDSIDFDNEQFVVDGSTKKFSDEYANLCDKVVRYPGGSTEYKIGPNHYCSSRFTVDKEKERICTIDVQSLIPLVKESYPLSERERLERICGLVNNNDVLLSSIGKAIYEYESENNRTEAKLSAACLPISAQAQASLRIL